MTDPKSIMVIGTFDGVHRGHQALFGEARRLADDYEAQVVAITFNKHPLTVLHPDRVPPQVMDLEQKAEALQVAGADTIRWLEPDGPLLALDPRAFIERMIADHNPLAIVEGQNFHFGHRRSGDIKVLRHLGKELGFEAIIADLVRVALGDKTIARVSSTLMRYLLANGRMADVTRCLGRPWVLRGKVVEGAKRGRKIGSPTANLDTGQQMLPADGVYAGRTTVDGQRYLVAVSVGTNPTFNNTHRTCEAFVLDYEGDLYGRELSIEMIRWLRDQWQFADADALRRQIAHDVQVIRSLAATDLFDPADANIHVEHVIAHD